MDKIMCLFCHKKAAIYHKNLMPARDWTNEWHFISTEDCSDWLRRIYSSPEFLDKDLQLFVCEEENCKLYFEIFSENHVR